MLSEDEDGRLILYLNNRMSTLEQTVNNFYRRFGMAARIPQPRFPYSVKINTATGTDATLPITLLTPKEAEELQVEFKKIVREAGARGARISVQRLAVDNYDQVLHEAKACVRKAMPKAA